MSIALMCAEPRNGNGGGLAGAMDVVPRTNGHQLEVSDEEATQTWPTGEKNEGIAFEFL